MVHGVRWSDGAISMDPPGPASGTHTYVALQTDMDEEELHRFWDNRATAAQRLENCRCFIDRVVVAGGNPIGQVRGLNVITARQLQRSANGQSVRGSAVRNRASSHRFAVTVHLVGSIEEPASTATRCTTIGESVFEGSGEQMDVAEVEAALSALNETCGEYSAALAAAEQAFEEQDAALEDTRAELASVTDAVVVLVGPR